MSLLKRKAKVYCEFTRLTFKKELIDKLESDDFIEIYVSNDNETFLMTKDDFYKTFDNVVKSKSYKIIGNYNYQKTPSKAYRYLKK